jgi:hypothetical protein
LAVPSTSKRKRPAEKLVELTTGPVVPELFEFTYPTEHGSWSVRVRTGADGVPRCTGYSEHVSGDGQAVAEMTDERWRRRVEYAIAEKAAKVASARMMEQAGVSWAVGPAFAEHYPDAELPADTFVLDQAEIDRVAEVAARAARPRPGRPGVSDADKLRALELVSTKGMAEAKRILGKEERTVRRWIADARQLIEERGHGVG